MTLIVLLILAAVSLSAVFSEKGIFSRAEIAGIKYNEAKAREVLETVLLADGQYEKNINPLYNQDKFLDDLIKSEIPETKIKGDVAIISGWAFELDRTVPKIGRSLGRADKLVFPIVSVSEPVLALDYRTSSFTAKAIEDKNGINKIELWLEGKIIEAYKQEYNNVKTEITKNFTVNKNGKYTVKVYGDIMASETVEVTGIVPSVEFTPNGNTEWKKTHTVKVAVNETGETVTEMKYLWVKDDGVNEPATNLFVKDCPSDRVITGGDYTMTGTYYLWILLTIGTGSNQKTSMYASQGFNFDNEAPTVELSSTPVSKTSFTLTATASDNNKSGIARYEFYVNGKKVDRPESEVSLPTVTINTGEMKENIECTVYAYDTSENYGSDMIDDGRTLLYTYHLHDYTPAIYGKVKTSSTSSRSLGADVFKSGYTDIVVDQETLRFVGVGDLVTASSGLVWNKYEIYGSDGQTARVLTGKSGIAGSEKYHIDVYRVKEITAESVADSFSTLRSTDGALYEDGEIRDGKKVFVVGLE